MLAGVDATKAPPAEVARRIVDAIATADQVVWPDDASAGASAICVADSLKLEELLAG